MGTEVDRAVPARLLACPDTVLNLCHDGTTDRTVGTNGFLDFSCCAGDSCLCRTNVAARYRDRSGYTTNRQTGAAQECTTVNNLFRNLAEKRR
jgi:hypothetical protein